MEELKVDAVKMTQLFLKVEWAYVYSVTSRGPRFCCMEMLLKNRTV